MAGENEYVIVYSDHFVTSLRENIWEWAEELNFSEEKICTFVQSIERALAFLKSYPELYEDVSQLYQFTEPTYRILIGKSYAMLYRMDHEKKQVLVGSFLKQKDLLLVTK